MRKKDHHSPVACFRFYLSTLQNGTDLYHIFSLCNIYAQWSTERA